MPTPPDQHPTPPERDEALIQEAKRQFGHAESGEGSEGATNPTTGGMKKITRSSIARHFPAIEGYRITGILGHGGMGIVYQAVQTKLNRTVALKVLPAIVSTANPSAVARFRREASAAARLHHTNIVPVYDFGESRDSYFYAMELIEGKPLSALIPRFAEHDAATASPARLATWLPEELAGATVISADGTLEPTSTHLGDSVATAATAAHRGAYFQHVARWMSDAADALHYAHSQRIIHRDIKPGNLILSMDLRIMIADFGLAKTSDDQSSYTMTGTLIGTLRYLSPEQAMAKRIRVDHRTDIYSLGATLYELLCFQPAFQGRDEKEVLGAIIARDPPPPHRIHSAVPAELGTICMKCMEKLPDARYTTARALADDLRRYLSDLPIVARRPSLLQRGVKFLRRHRAVVTAASVALVLIVSAGLFFRHRAAEQTRVATRLSNLIKDASLFVTNGWWDDAAKSYEEALILSPDNIEVLANYARLKKDWYNAQADPDPNLLVEADDLCRRALAVDTRNPEMWNLQGVISKKLKRYEEAAAAYRNAIALDPTNDAAWENLGVVRALAHDLAGAASSLRRSAELLGSKLRDCESPWRNLAAVELFMGNVAAVEHLATARQCNPADPTTLRLAARLYLELDGHDDPKVAMDNAQNADSKAVGLDARTKRLEAMAAVRLGEFNQALKHAEAALQLGDMETVNRLIEAIAYARLGDLDEARVRHGLALERWPDSLREDDAFNVDAARGALWIESARQLRALEHEVEELLQSPPGDR